MRLSFSSSLASSAAIFSETAGAASSPGSASSMGSRAEGSAVFADDGFDLVGEAFLCSAFEAGLVAGFVGGGYGCSYDIVALAEVDAAVAVGGAAHGAEVLLVEADGHAVVGGEEDDLVAVGDAGGDELVVLVDADGDDAAGLDVGEVLERGSSSRCRCGWRRGCSCLLLRGRGRGGW